MKAALLTMWTSAKTIDNMQHEPLYRRRHLNNMTH